MRNIRLNRDLPKTADGFTVICAHGTTHYKPEDYEYQVVQAGGRVIEDNTSYHRYNRFLCKGGLEAMKQVDWYKWAFVSHYPNGRPTEALMVYEYEKYKEKIKQIG